MKQTSIRLWREALEELWRRRLRTALTLLGLIFGVGAIVAMQAVGEGSRREALRLVQSLGLQNLIVESLPVEGDLLQERRARSLGLSRRDADALRHSVPGVDACPAWTRWPPKSACARSPSAAISTAATRVPAASCRTTLSSHICNSPRDVR